MAADETLVPNRDLNLANLLPMIEHFQEGGVITDAEGRIVHSSSSCGRA